MSDLRIRVIDHGVTELDFDVMGAARPFLRSAGIYDELCRHVGRAGKLVRLKGFDENPDGELPTPGPLSLAIDRVARYPKHFMALCRDEESSDMDAIERYATILGALCQLREACATYPNATVEITKQ